MSGKNRRLVADEPVEFEKKTVEVQDFRKFNDHLRWRYQLKLAIWVNMRQSIPWQRALGM